MSDHETFVVNNSGQLFLNGLLIDNAHPRLVPVEGLVPVAVSIPIEHAPVPESVPTSFLVLDNGSILHEGVGNAEAEAEAEVEDDADYGDPWDDEDEDADDADDADADADAESGDEAETDEAEEPSIRYFSVRDSGVVEMSPAEAEVQADLDTEEQSEPTTVFYVDDSGDLYDTPEDAGHETDQDEDDAYDADDYCDGDCANCSHR